MFSCNACGAEGRGGDGLCNGCSTRFDLLLGRFPEFKDRKFELMDLLVKHKGVLKDVIPAIKERAKRYTKGTKHEDHWELIDQVHKVQKSALTSNEYLRLEHFVRISDRPFLDDEWTYEEKLLYLDNMIDACLIVKDFKNASEFNTLRNDYQNRKKKGADK